MNNNIKPQFLQPRLANKISSGLNKELLRMSDGNELIMTPPYFKAVDAKAFVGDAVLYLQMKIASRSKVKDAVILTQAVLGAFVHHYHYHPDMSFDKVFFIYYVWSDLDKDVVLNNCTLLMNGLVNGLKSLIDQKCNEVDEIFRLSKDRDRLSFVNHLVSRLSKNQTMFNLDAKIPFDSTEVIRDALKSIFGMEFSEPQTYSTVGNIRSHFESCIRFLNRFEKVNFNKNVKVVNKGDLDQWLIPTTRAFPRLMEAIEELE